MTITLPDALAALEGRKEFAIRRSNGLVVINYVVQMPGTFDGIRANFRGIAFDEETGECISRPLHKFYGVGQAEATMFDRIKDRSATIFEKLDGSLVHWLIHRGELRAATRMGPGSAQAEAAAAFAFGARMLKSIENEVEAGWTPMFEFLSPRFPIVVRHPRDRLVYLCSRHRETGKYRFVNDYPDAVSCYTFPFADLMAQLIGRHDFEGFVCWLDDGTTVKAKCNWYLERHRAFDAMLRPAYKLYGLALDGVMDDLIAAAQPHHKGPLERVWAEAQGDYLAERERLQSLTCEVANAHPGGADPKARRKAFVEIVRDRSPSDLGGLMRLYDGKPADDVIRARLMDGYRAKYPDPILVGAEEAS